MRLNRETIILLVVSLVVIGGAWALSNQPGSVAEPTPTAPVEGAGPIFPSIVEETSQVSLVRFEVINNATDERVVLTKDETDIWTVEEATYSSALDTDQTKAVGTVGVMASLSAVQSFTTDNLAQFGLDAPTHTLVLTDQDGITYTLKIGNKNPATPRYYALVNDTTDTIYVLPQDLVDGLTRQITQPPYVPSPTPTASPTRTPNPLSEVDQTATAEAEQTLFAEILLPTSTPTDEAALEATQAEPDDATEPAAAEPAEDEATATSEPSATRTPRPSSTPQPTVAPTLTRTPRPSSTPRPTAAP